MLKNQEKRFENTELENLFESKIVAFRENTHIRRGGKLLSGDNNKFNKIRDCLTIAWELCDIKCAEDFNQAVFNAVAKKLISTKKRDGSHRSPNTVKHYMDAVQGFFNYLKESEQIAFNPLQNAKKLIRQSAKIRKTPETEKVEKLVDSINLTDPISHRNLMALILIADLGCRSGAVRTLRIGNIDFEKASIDVGFSDSSGNVQEGLKGFCQVLPLNAGVVRLLKNYLDTSWLKFKNFELTRGAPTSDRLPDPNLLFPSVNCLELSKNSFSDIMSTELRKHGLLGITPHALRKHLILALSRNGASIPEIMLVTGHKSHQAISQYLKEDPTKIKSIHQKHNPHWGANSLIAKAMQNGGSHEKVA